MDCKDARRRLSAYIDNELSLKERQLIERHLEDCPFCASEERELQIVSFLMDKISDEDTSPFFAERVISKVKTGIGEPGRVYLLKPVLAGLLAIVLLLIGIALNLNNTGSSNFYAYLKNFDDFPPESFSSIYISAIKGDSK